jgi:tRNA-splicing ligase RtcB
MPYNKLNISGAKADVLAWVNHDLSIDEQNMLRNVSRLPCLYKHVALMPDAHLGIGSMVGSVVATKDAVIPATVGVDIGCGMAVKTPFKSGFSTAKLKELRHEIERAIPVGFNAYKESVDESSRWEGWEEFEAAQRRAGPQEKSDGSAGHARRRQPLYRSLSRHRRQRLADAAFRLAQHRQGNRRTPHRDGEISA